MKDRLQPVMLEAQTFSRLLFVLIGCATLPSQVGDNNNNNDNDNGLQLPN